VLYEIRNYHYDPAKFELYKQWAIEEAVPFLKANLDIVGFWVDSGDQSEVYGKTPMELPLGSSNITWILRWHDMDDRNAGHERVFKGEGWKAVWANHPDADGYLQMEAKFAEEL
jgi:hypothetical protein